MSDIADKLPKVAIVGRPNVGKSSLFNRIIGQRKAIVYQETGTTRDSISQEVISENKKFIITDTGGFIQGDRTQMMRLIKAQIRRAISEADVLLFTCDGQAGLTAQDLELAKILRKADKQVFLVVNKIDNEKIGEGAVDFYKLGLDKPYSVSALHDIGISELLNDVVTKFPEASGPGEKAGGIRTAIVGRPNVGKSSFLNYLLKEERLIVDETPGTTRDAIDISLRDGDEEFILIDTAGLRHKRKIKEAVDVYSMMRTYEAIKRSEICLVLIDGYQGIVMDDLQILNSVLKEGKCCVVCVNKWDLVKDIPVSKYNEMIHSRAAFLKNYPVLFTSAITGYNVYNSLAMIKEILGKAHVKIPTQMLNRLLANIKLRGPFASSKNSAKLSYITQTQVSPPTFLIFVNNPGEVSETHRNFIENMFRKNFDFFGVPIKFNFRSQKGGRR